ncbi:MAG: DNA-3-methyladenine glycosylase [Cyclonatronaceae bacterium]
MSDLLTETIHNRLPRAFFEGDDVVATARGLLGKRLCTYIDGQFTVGRVVETEAYAAVGDQACHAHLGRFTERTKTMYEPGGTAYIYLCYGIHHLFNIVCNVKGTPDAVLIRAVEPLHGAEIMLERRNMEKPARKLTAGPGILSQALGITKAFNEENLCASERVWLCHEETSYSLPKPAEIAAGPRVGIDYAGEDAALPWRFWIAGTKWKSPAK